MRPPVPNIRIPDARPIAAPESTMAWLALFLCAWLLQGCAANPRSSGTDLAAQTDEAENGHASGDADYSMAPPAPRSASSLLAKKAGSDPSPYPAADGYQAGKPIAQAPLPARKRLVHYHGEATLRSTEPERILDSAIAVARAGGGYLEQRSGLYAALRVPSDRFDSLFRRIMRLAEVVSYTQEAEDVSEAMQDVEMRLKVITATLERLEDLVRKAKTENQKLTLLRELKRLREEKEVLESSRRDLSQKARFASIRLWLQSHVPVAGAAGLGDLADFRWIRRLSPFDERRFRGRSVLRFQAPEGMVVTRKWFRPWRATSSQGSEFWGSELEVDPRGDSRFWAEAIRNRLKDGFKSVETREAGGFSLCRFQSYGPAPYYYWVGVRSRGGEIDLAEFYFPNEDQQTALLPGILASVERRSK